MYDTLIETAKRLISQRGMSVTYRQYVDSKVVYNQNLTLSGDPITLNGDALNLTLTENDDPVDPTKPWKPGSPVTIEHSVKIVFIPNERYEREQLRYWTGSDLPKGDEFGYMAQVSFEPKLKDVVVRNGEPLPISSVKKYAPDGRNILYVIGFGGDEGG